MSELTGEEKALLASLSKPRYTMDELEKELDKISQTHGFSSYREFERAGLLGKAIKASEDEC
jgi:hypothetical protein